MASRGTQTDAYELFLNGIPKLEEFITKDGNTFRFNVQSERIAFYTCSSSSNCKKMAYVIKRSGKVVVRGPDHNHDTK